MFQETNQTQSFANYTNNQNYMLNNNSPQNMNGNLNFYYKNYLQQIMNQMNIKNQLSTNAIMHNQMLHQMNNQTNNQLNNQVQLQLLLQMINQKNTSEYNQINTLNNNQQYILQYNNNYRINKDNYNLQQNPNFNMNNHFIQQYNHPNNINYQNQINQHNYINSLIVNQIENTKQPQTQPQLQQQTIIDINQIDDNEIPKEQETLFLPGEIYSKKATKKHSLLSSTIFKLMHNGTSLTKRPHLMINKNGKKLSPYNSLDKIYIPNLNDFVIGIIVQKNSDNYKLDINSLLPGVLEKEKHDSNKRTKDYENGDLILCRVTSTNRNDYYQLSTDEFKKPKDIKIDSHLGKLINGTVFEIPLNKVKLLNKDFDEFKNTNFSFTVGHNGKLFIMPNVSFIYNEIVPLYNQILQRLQTKKDN